MIAIAYSLTINSTSCSVLNYEWMVKTWARLSCFFCYKSFSSSSYTLQLKTLQLLLLWTLPALLPYVGLVTSELTSTGNHMVWPDPGIIALGSKLPFLVKKGVTSFSLNHASHILFIPSFMSKMDTSNPNGSTGVCYVARSLTTFSLLVDWFTIVMITQLWRIKSN